MNDIYRHYKGGVYHKLHEARSSDDPNKIMVVYEHLWPHERQIWVREKTEFEGLTADGKQRFERIC